MFLLLKFFEVQLLKSSERDLSCSAFPSKLLLPKEKRILRHLILYNKNCAWFKYLLFLAMIYCSIKFGSFILFYYFWEIYLESYSNPSIYFSEGQYMLCYFDLLLFWIFIFECIYIWFSININRRYLVYFMFSFVSSLSHFCRRNVSR